MLRVLILVVALVLGGLTSWMAFQGMGENSGSQVAQAPETPMVDVLIAARKLPAGSAIEASGLTWQTWPQDAVQQGSFITRTEYETAATDLEGTVVRDTFYKGEPVLQDKLAAPESGFLAALLPAGKRAVSVKISAENTAGGFILPNDYVDVIHTQSRAANGGIEMHSASSTIARNIRVLAIDQTVVEKNNEVTVVGKTATLEVDPDQVELIMAAESSGSVSLSLRPAADSGALAVLPEEEEVVEVPVAEPVVVVEPEPEPEPVLALETRQIRMISAGQSSTISTPVHVTR